MTSLSDSFAVSLDLLEQNKVDEAAQQFRKGFVATVKKLYVEAGKTYPIRYEKADCWTAWTKRLYILTRKAEDAFQAGDSKLARELLPQLRRHFYDLHQQTGTHKSNDYIFAFQEMLAGAQPSRDGLKTALDQVLSAQPAMKAKADTAAYEKARDEWGGRIAAMMESGNLNADTLDQMRKSSVNFYKAFGLQFE